MTPMDAILTRRSIRKFTDKQPTPEQIEAVVRAGMYAPSGHNIRNWNFITVTDREKLKAMSELNQYWKPLANATLGIVTIMDKTGEPEYRHEYSVQNGAAATENMLIALHILGLGGVWLNCGIQLPHHDDVLKFFGIEQENMHIVSVIAAGEPIKVPEHPDRFDEEKWHKEVW